MSSPARGPVPGGLYTDQATLVDSRGHVYVKLLLGDPREDEPWPVGLLRFDADGEVVDTIPPPRIEGEPTGAGLGRFLPAKVWTALRRGSS